LAATNQFLPRTTFVAGFFYLLINKDLTVLTLTPSTSGGGEGAGNEARIEAGEYTACIAIFINA
jgi:hypothetical protein